jgi:hypothetical protein
MLRPSLYVLAAAGLLSSFPAAAADVDMQALRDEIAQMKAAYERRIAALESRLASAEKSVSKAAGNSQNALSTAEDSRRPQPGLATGFNPQISVILDGVYYRDGRKNKGPGLLESIDGINHAHAHDGHDHGALESGFNLRETELIFSAAVSPYFDANLKMTVASGGDVELEEAYFDTRVLPAGLKLRGGKFQSGIGYLNAQHPHQWDFVDQNLAYRSLLGEHGLNDTGLRLEWVPKTGNWYSLLGLEVLQGKEQLFATAGESTPMGRADGAALAATSAGQLGGTKRGPRLSTVYAKFAPDLGDKHALQFGVWGAWAKQHQEVHDHTDEDPANLVQGLQGRSRLWGTDWVYKYDAAQHGGWGNVKLAAEYLRATKNLKVAFHEQGNQLGQKREFIQDGFYLQGNYGFLPFWQAGLRYDVTGMTNEINGPAGRLVDMDPSRRWTFALSRELTEFSRFRLQFSRAKLMVEGMRENLNEVYLQYQHSLGAHGAHLF